MTIPPIYRLLAKVKVDENGCWRFTGCHGGGGYGWITISRDIGRKVVHRVTYEHFIGPIPADLTLDHLCRVRDCCNPAHLEPVSRGENVMRGVGFAATNAAKTHCPKGHEYTAANTYRDSSHPTCRTCKRCVRDSQKAKYHAAKAV